MYLLVFYFTDETIDEIIEYRTAMEFTSLEMMNWFINHYKVKVIKKYKIEKEID